MSRLFLKTIVLAALCVLTVSAADPAAPRVSKIFDQDLSTVEHELVPLAEAMPSDKYNFAPTHGEFAGVRTRRAQHGQCIRRRMVDYMNACPSLAAESDHQGDCLVFGLTRTRLKECFVVPRIQPCN